MTYEGISKIRERIIEEAKDDIPKLDMFSFYILAEMRMQTVIMAYSGKKNERFVDISEEEIEKLIEGINICIEKENAKKT